MRRVVAPRHWGGARGQRDCRRQRCGEHDGSPFPAGHRLFASFAMRLLKPGHPPGRRNTPHRPPEQAEPSPAKSPAVASASVTLATARYKFLERLGAARQVQRV